MSKKINDGMQVIASVQLNQHNYHLIKRGNSYYMNIYKGDKLINKNNPISKENALNTFFNMILFHN